METEEQEHTEITSKRAMTMSKHFYDDEILFKDPENGDIHLKEGVKREGGNSISSTEYGSISLLEETEEFNLVRRELLGLNERTDGGADEV